MQVEIWSYRRLQGFDPLAGHDVTGYAVEAKDGSIGKVDEATYDVGSSFIVVDTGPWIFGKQVMLPAGVIERVDTDEEKVYVDATKDEIKAAPELDEVLRDDPAYRDRLGSYYAGRGETPAESRADLSL
jgi:hypothetical protein